MKKAVNNFISAVNEKYSAEADHRIALVTFGSNASTLQDWTTVDNAGKTALQGKVNSLPNTPSGATNAGAGMETAESLMGSGCHYTGANTTRQKVGGLFTDGVPTTSSDFDTGVADSAIKSAKHLKDAGVTVYSVGIFKGANPDELYGASNFDQNSNGAVGSHWANFSILKIGDIKNYDIPAGNRFLNYLSSNFANASNIGIKDYSSTILGIGYYGWEITQNFNRTASGYYLSTDNADSLNTIFKTISDQISTPTINLGSEAVVKDIISDYFELPDGAAAKDIKVYTADATALALENPTGANAWEAKVPANLTPIIQWKTISVTGFDYNANFVSDKKKDGSEAAYGRKLIIQFNVTVRKGFLGGNNVPTNGAASGLYENGQATTPLETFEQPTVNVPIKDVTVTAEDKNVYLLGGVTTDQLKTGATVNCGNIPLDLSKANDNYGLEAWQYDYVKLNTEVKKADGTVLTNGYTGLTDDTTYTVSVAVKPRYDGKNSEGTPATEQSGTNTPAANINVFKPELTFKDTEAYYGEDVATDFTTNKVGGTVWKHGDTASTDVTMLSDTVPTLDITYTPDESTVKDNKYTKVDAKVKATVKIGDTDVTQYTTFQHQACKPACDWKIPTKKGDPAFLIHIKTCKLTITKEGGEEDESYVFNILKDGKKYSEVTIVGNRTETLYELPIGTYTIQEDTGWSWRFTPKYSADAKLSAEIPTGTITCTNNQKKDKDKWINGFSNVVRNIFEKVTTK